MARASLSGNVFADSSGQHGPTVYGSRRVRLGGASIRIRVADCFNELLGRPVVVGSHVMCDQGWSNEYRLQLLREKLGKRRIILDDTQRRRLAVKGKILGHKLLGQIATLFTPDTIMRWHHKLVAQKWDYSHRRQKKPGRPTLPAEVVDLVVRLAKENSS